MLCTAQDGSTAALALPKRRAVSAPLTITLAQPAELLHPVVAKGYKLAWRGDRLNPNRVRGPAFGQAQQDMIWSTGTPARLLTPAERAERQAEAALSVSAKGQAARARFVQVGQFSDPANVGAACRARAAGGRGAARAEGRPRRPFETTAEARAALKLVRKGGFPDAFLR